MTAPTRLRALRCVEGRLFRHDPQHDDPYLETDVGECLDCAGAGCGEPPILTEIDRLKAEGAA